jgi:hypothetical protein
MRCNFWIVFRRFPIWISPQDKPLCLRFLVIFLGHSKSVEAGIAQSVQRLATGWKVRGSNPGGARFSAHIQTGSGANPASCTVGSGSFPGVKAAKRDADHTPPSSAEVKKELSYTSTHPMGPPGPVTGFPLL